MKRKYRALDIVLVAALVLMTVIYMAKYINFSAVPFEDAAMIMRYADNVACGHGIVWNIGEKPVDGATDFLFMMLTAGLVKAGLPAVSAVRLIVIVSHLLLVVFVYVAMRRLHLIHPILAFISSAFLAAGYAIRYIEAYFGTPFFALFSGITWYFAHGVLDEPNNKSAAGMFALSGLILGLIRPEGVFLFVFMVIGIILANGIYASLRGLLPALLLYSALGGAYFVWHWHYFGFPLPNPFYVKGGGVIHVTGFVGSVSNVVSMTAPFLALILSGYYFSINARYVRFAVIPIAGFTLLWGLLSNEMNYYMRFQYPLLPIALMSWPGLYRKAGQIQEHPLNMKLILAAMTALLCLIIYQHRNNASPKNRDGRYDAAVMLGKFANKNYVMVTTEAGLLPYFSRWKAIDAWGLNDRWIAHNGTITDSYLAGCKPQLIIFHAYFSPLTAQKLTGAWFTKWSAMTETLKNYAERNKYILAASFGDSPYDTHYYFVSRDFPESDEIVKNIRGMDYYWAETGRRSLNFAFYEKDFNGK